MAAQTSVGLVLGAAIWARGVRPRPAMVLFLVAIAMAVALPVEAEFLHGIGATIGPEHAKRVLKVAAGLTTVGALLTRQRLVAIVAVLGEIVLWPITNYIQDCDWELAALYLGFFGLLVGLLRDRRGPSADLAGDSGGDDATPPEGMDRYWVDDVGAFVVGTVAGSVTCWILLHGQTNSADEWANTFQAALFAKFHAYGSVPHCSEAFRNFYVFQFMGRSFAQYTPGWPYFMTPFVALHLAWLAGPASLGLLAAGASRLARRAAAGVSPGTAPPSSAHLRAAGWFACGAIVLSSTLLINGGSRYPHVFVVAMFAWSVELLCAVATPGLPNRAQRTWGAWLGACAALMVTARPGDGATLGVGLFAYLAYALARRRIGWRSFAAAAATLIVIGGVSLIILRLQLGRWFTTGYSLNETVYPWNETKWSMPKPNEYRTAFPIGTGSYCWWPCSPAIGLAGIAALRGRARRLGFIFFFSMVPVLAFYLFCESGREFDFGYGPRYQMVTVAPMAVGTGVVLAYLWTRARTPMADASALHLGGPVALALVAVFLGVVRIAPLVYPFNYADVREHNRLHDAIDKASLHNAIVFGEAGLNRTDPMDLTENLPLELYPDQDVLIAIDRGPDEVACVREKYRGRVIYRALPGDPVRLLRY
jgi:hypothetical protein